MPTRLEWAKRQYRGMDQGDPNWRNPDWVRGYLEGLATSIRACYSLSRDLEAFKRVVEDYIEDKFGEPDDEQAE